MLLAGIIQVLIKEIERLVAAYMQNEEERIKSKGCVAFCIIDVDGNINGKMFGDDMMLKRERFDVAWRKANQAWITRHKTGDFEKMVFNGELAESSFSIRKPDYIGWFGGQPVTLKNGTVLYIGFSGFNGATDVELVTKAVKSAEDSL